MTSELRTSSSTDGALDAPPDPAAELRLECAGCGAGTGEGAESCGHCGGVLKPLPAGQPIAGRYRLDRLIGKGGMGKVYRALDLRLGRAVAIKILPDHLTGNQEALQRFKREARALAALTHPQVLTIYEFDTDQGLSYIVTELLTGETLRERMSRSAPTPDRMLEIARGLAEGLAAMHDKGITHRDLKPENIFLTEGGSVKILDLGIARFVERAPADLLTSLQTEEGRVLGTIPYMSPEQLRGEKADPRSDVFSFGCVLSEMISGRAPFPVRLIAGAEAAAQDDPLRSVRAFSPELEQVVRRCLEKDPRDRYPSGRELSEALKSLSGGSVTMGLGFRAWRHRPAWGSLWRLAALFGGLALVAGAAALINQPDRLSRMVRPFVERETGERAEERNELREVLKYHLEQGRPEGQDQTYKFHFIPRQSGFFYILAPGKNDLPTAFLTDLPDPRSGVKTNRCEAGSEYIFPAGDHNWIQVTSDEPLTTFTIIFRPLAPALPPSGSADGGLPAPDSLPSVLRARAGQTLKAEAQSELETWRRPFRIDSSKFVSLPDGNRRLVTVPILSGQSARTPVSFEIAIGGQSIN
ncbi:MAG TPA: serine/threonine-protein kinase [Blastocatellia bacterium]|nr:serine/threonine-protein kinase [Blastocatellia bacterium]